MASGGIVLPTSLLGLVLGVLLATSTEAAGNTEVFDLGDELKPLPYTLMMTLVIVGLSAFDLAVEHLEHYLHHEKGRFHQRLLKKAFKELMILGTISFVLFILNDQAIYDQTDEVFTNTFDFVNLFLFFVGVSLVLAAVLLVLATAPLKDRWDTYASVSLPKLLALHEESASKSWTWYASWPPRYFCGLRKAQVIEYHLFRSVFTRLNRSLLTTAFDFSKYSAAIVDEIIIVFFDVGWASWLLAVVVLFFTLPFSDNGEDGSAEVTAQGTIIFGVALLVLEAITCTYIHYAHSTVSARIGVVGGFKGIGKVLEELWVEPLHYMGQETSAIDVKDLLAAAPVKAPTLQELTAEISFSTKGAVSQAQVNFKASRVSGSTSSTRRSIRSTSSGRGDGTSISSEDKQGAAAPATDTIAAVTSRGEGETKSPCLDNGPGCSGCYTCDSLWLPPGRVQKCGMGGDPFAVATIRPPQWAVDRLPALKGTGVNVGSYWLFKTLFGMCTLLKCYYCAFYFSYGIGRATETSTTHTILWVLLTPIPVLLALVPLAKRTLPIYAQLACLQGQIVWELVSDIEEQQEMAAQARVRVLSKLQEALAQKTRDYNTLDETSAGAKSGETVASLRSRAMEDWFAEWDEDGNGEISRTELARGLQELGIFLSMTQLKELFRLADPDHSKSIDLQEFRTFLSDLHSLESEPDRYGQELEKRLERASLIAELSRTSGRTDEFDLLDANFDSSPALLQQTDGAGGGPFRVAGGVDGDQGALPASQRSMPVGRIFGTTSHLRRITHDDSFDPEADLATAVLGDAGVVDEGRSCGEPATGAGEAQPVVAGPVSSSGSTEGSAARWAWCDEHETS